MLIIWNITTTTTTKKLQIIKQGKGVGKKIADI